MTRRRGGLLESLVGAARSRTFPTGSGNVITETFDVSGIRRIEVHSTFVVRVAVGERESMTVRIDDNLRDLLDVGVETDTLVIGLLPHLSLRRATLEADVVVTSLEGIAASDASEIEVTDPLPRSGEFDLRASGASEVALGRGVTSRRVGIRLSGASILEALLDTDEAEVAASGASRARMSGRAPRVVISASGASTLRFDDLDSARVDARLSGASRAAVMVREEASVRLSGASRLDYRGDPRFTRREVSGASSVRAI